MAIRYNVGGQGEKLDPNQYKVKKTLKIVTVTSFSQF